MSAATAAIFAALTDVWVQLDELGLAPAGGPPDLAGFAPAARAAAARLRAGGAESQARALEAVLDRLTSDAVLAAAGRGGIPAPALCDALRDTAALLAEGLVRLPAGGLGAQNFGLRQAVGVLSAALERRDAPPTAATPEAALAAADRLLHALPAAEAEAAAAHLDHLAELAAVERAALLAGEAPLPSVEAVRDVLLNLAALLAPPASDLSPRCWTGDRSGLVSPRWRRVFHAHLPKCAGTSLNAWLDTLVGDLRRWDSATLSLRVATNISQRELAAGRPPASPGKTLREASIAARLAFHLADAVHDHAPLLLGAPEGTLAFTVLRAAEPRLVSQIADWRRLTPEDRARQPAEYAAMLADASQLPLAEFLRAHGRGPSRSRLDNTMTRLLAAGRLGPWALETEDTAPLLEPALASLEQDFALVGVTEESAATRNALAELLGLPPVGAFTRLNESGAGRPAAAEVDAAAAEIAPLVALDKVLHARATRIFAVRHATAAAAWSDAAFEARDAAAVTSQLRGVFHEGAIVHGVAGPLIGRGFHARDSAGQDNVAVWSGPEPALVLYLPVPDALDLTLLLWVRGYAHSSTRARLAVRVDGQRVPHGFEPCPGWAERIVVPFRPRRPFVRLEVDVGETFADPPNDPRLRGLSFDAFGWRPC